MRKKFCRVKIYLYFCTRKRGEIRLPKESAFSPYSDRVNLDNLHINYDARNTGVTKCFHWIIVSFVEQFSTPLYSHHREVETLTRENRDKMDWLHFLRIINPHRASATKRKKYEESTFCARNDDDGFLRKCL